MTYTGPKSGILNIIPLASGASDYVPIPPDANVGNDGDYALDLNTNILYGPKNSADTFNVWPVGTRLSGEIVWQGTFDETQTYNTGDAVEDNANFDVGYYYVCVKPFSTKSPPTVNNTDTGNWNPGDFVYASYGSTSGGSNRLWICISSTTSAPDGDVSGNANYWVEYSIFWDANNYSGAGGNWRALYSTNVPEPNVPITVDSTVSVGSRTNYTVADLGITTNKIDGSAVTSAKLATDAVTTAKIKNSTGSSDGVTTAKLATNAVTTAKITDSNVTFAKLASAAIASSSDTSSNKLVVASDTRLSDGRNPDLTYVSQSSYGFGYYNIPVGTRFVEIQTTTPTQLTDIRFKDVPSTNAVYWIKNSSSSTITISNTISGGVINYPGTSGATSFTLAAGATAMLVYAGSNKFNRIDAINASQITTGTLESLNINNPTVKGGGYTAFTLSNFGDAPLVNFDSNAQIVNAHFNPGGAYFYGSSGAYSTKLQGSSTGSATVTLPGSTGTIALTSDNITGTSAGITGKTIGGTTAGDIVTIDATQTLTNKTLTAPTLSAGTTTVAAMKFTQATPTTTAQAGALEADSSGIYYSTANSTRKTIAFTDTNISGTAAGVSSGSITATGAVSLPYRAITAARTLDATDYTIDCTGGPYSVTLPSAATAGAGRIYNIKNSGTGTITIARAGTDTIDGAASITMNGSIKQYQTITLQSTGSAWIIL